MSTVAVAATATALKRKTAPVKGAPSTSGVASGGDKRKGGGVALAAAAAPRPAPTAVKEAGGGGGGSGSGEGEEVAEEEESEKSKAAAARKTKVREASRVCFGVSVGWMDGKQLLLRGARCAK